MNPAADLAVKLVKPLSALSLPQQITVGSYVARQVEKHPLHDWPKAMLSYRAAGVIGWPDTVILEVFGQWTVLRALAVSKDGQLVKEYVHDGRAPSRQPAREEVRQVGA